MLVSLAQQPIKFWHWSAKWAWFGTLFAAAVGVIALSEYAFSAVFFLLSALGAFSKLLHLDGSKTKSNWKATSKIGGSVAIWTLFAMLIYSLNAERGTKPWSHFQPPLETLLANKWFPLSSDAREIPALPLKYCPPNGPEISKVYFGPSKIEGKKALPPQLMEVAPPIYRTDLFTTYVMFDAGHKNSPVVCPGDSIRTVICAEFREAIKGNIPPDQSVLPQFFGIALQHYLIVLVEYAGEEWGMHGDSPKGLSEKFMPPIDVPDGETYELNQMLNLADADRSVFPPELIFKRRLKLPRHSAASFVSTTDVESYILRLERSGYYRLDLGVSLLLKNPIGRTPENLDIGFPDTSRITTYDYRIKLDLTVQRRNDPTFIPSDYVEWGQSLFNNIRGKLEH